MSRPASDEPRQDEPASEAPISDARGSDALAGFTGKWRARWPEWAVAEVFVPAAQRQIALAWAALQQELTDAAWGGNDPRPGEAKLAWWQEELHGWVAGRRRHPLGTVLQRQVAPWATLGAALPTLPASRERARDPEEAFDALRAFADAVVAVDAALFARSGGTTAAAHDRLPVVATLLAVRIVQSGDHPVPLSVLAQPGPDPGARWRGHLTVHWPAAGAATRPRRLWAALARARLLQADPARPLSSWRALAVGWRAARGTRN